MTKEKFPNPKTWLNIPLCESIYNIFRDNLEVILPHGEPLPSFSTRYSGRLESIINFADLTLLVSEDKTVTPGQMVNILTPLFEELIVPLE